MCPSINVLSCAKCVSFLVEYMHDENAYCKKCFLNICFDGVLRGDFPETATMAEFRKNINDMKIPISSTD